MCVLLPFSWAPRFPSRRIRCNVSQMARDEHVLPQQVVEAALVGPGQLSPDVDLRDDHFGELAHLHGRAGRIGLDVLLRERSEQRQVGLVRAQVLEVARLHPRLPGQVDAGVVAVHVKMFSNGRAMDSGFYPMLLQPVG